MDTKKQLRRQKALSRNYKLLENKSFLTSEEELRISNEIRSLSFYLSGGKKKKIRRGK